MIDFLNSELELQIEQTKTGILSGQKGIVFLSYRINTWKTSKTLKRKIKGTYNTTRTVSEAISLRVPVEQVIKFNLKNHYGDWYKIEPIHRKELCNSSDEEIILTYNLELKGLANYYALSYDVKNKLSQLEYMANYSLFKTLTGKHKSKLTTTLKKLKIGNEFIHRYSISGKPKEMKVFRLKHMKKKATRWEEIDKIPKNLYLTMSRSELIHRIEADTCEFCGKDTPDCEVHHVRKLKDLKSKPKLEYWEKVMIARHRKTIILCIECHDLLHAGKLPDNRYKKVSISRL